MTCFVKVFAMSFLGMRRLDEDHQVTEARPARLAPMAILAALCLAFGVLPTYVIPALDPALRPVGGRQRHRRTGAAVLRLAPGARHLPAAFVGEFHDLGAQVGQSVLPGRGLVVLHRGGKENPVVFAMSTSYMLVVLIAAAGLPTRSIRLWLTRHRQLVRRTRWDGGVRRLLPEMTYTATGFSNPVRVIFDAVFRPTTVEDTRETVAEHFRTAIRREKERVHPVDRLVFQPTRKAALGIARCLAAMHHGRINAYITYALLTLLIAWIVFSLLPASVARGFSEQRRQQGVKSVARTTSASGTLVSDAMGCGFVAGGEDDGGDVGFAHPSDTVSGEFSLPVLGMLPQRLGRRSGRLHHRRSSASARAGKYVSTGRRRQVSSWECLLQRFGPDVRRCFSGMRASTWQWPVFQFPRR